MPPRRGSSRERPSARLSLEEMRSAIERLKARIVDLQDLDLTKIVDRTDEVIHPVQAKIRATIASIYGEDTTDFVRLRPATHIDHTEYVITFGESRRYGADELREGVDRGRKKAVALLEGEIQALSETLQYTSGVGIDSGVGPIVPATPQNDEIFIVHGHDDAAKTEVALFVERAGLKPIILHEQPNQGRTIIEKFEKHGATASFAIIILTPDDVGGVSADQLAPRADKM